MTVGLSSKTRCGNLQLKLRGKPELHLRSMSEQEANDKKLVKAHVLNYLRKLDVSSMEAFHELVHGVSKALELCLTMGNLLIN